MSKKASKSSGKVAKRAGKVLPGSFMGIRIVDRCREAAGDDGQRIRKLFQHSSSGWLWGQAVQPVPEERRKIWSLPVQATRVPLARRRSRRSPQRTAQRHPHRSGLPARRAQRQAVAGSRQACCDIRPIQKTAPRHRSRHRTQARRDRREDELPHVRLVHHRVLEARRGLTPPGTRRALVRSQSLTRAAALPLPHRRNCV